ncbi:DUF2963 domain-containing protein [Candidatus Phytoplasma solani]
MKIQSISEFDKVTKNLVRTTDYNPKGTIKEILTY